MVYQCGLHVFTRTEPRTQQNLSHLCSLLAYGLVAGIRVLIGLVTLGLSLIYPLHTSLSFVGLILMQTEAGLGAVGLGS